MHDIVAIGQRFSDHFYSKPTTGQVVAGCAISFRVGDNRKLSHGGSNQNVERGHF